MFETPLHHGPVGDGEVVVEHRYPIRAGRSSREVWVCHAPSAEHIERWATAAHLKLSKVVGLACR
jgi:hypothetical protein